LSQKDLIMLLKEAIQEAEFQSQVCSLFKT